MRSASGPLWNGARDPNPHQENNQKDTEMPVYVVSRVKINDHDTMKDYMQDAPATVEKFGGRYLARTKDIEVLEGQADYNRMVLLEFPSREQALAWYHSEGYRELRDTRWSASDAHIVVLPGEMT